MIITFDAPRRHRQAGFSMLELVIVIILISLLIIVAIDRLLALRVDAERVAVEQLAGTIRSAMGINVAATVARDGGLQNIVKLHRSNPMRLLSETPGTYLGEIDNAAPGNIEPGSWYFDKQKRLLVYRVINSGFLDTRLDPPARIRFQLRLDFTDKNRNQRYDAGHDSIHGLTLVAAEPYKWRRHDVPADPGEANNS